MHLTSDLLSKIPGLEHAFGTRQDSLPEPFASAWDRMRPQWKQVHGVAAAEVLAPGQACGDVDALFSRQPGIPIAIQTADCVPVLLARRDGGAVAAVHAGWRGTQARILHSLWKSLAERGEKPADWVAAVGPSIGPCCYEVSEEMATDFATRFAKAGPAIAVPRHRHLDLPAVNTFQLRDELGLGEVDVLRACTLCSRTEAGEPRFWSYRRGDKGQRQWSVLWRRATS